MKTIQIDSEITLLNKKYNVSDFVLNCSVLSGQQVVAYFNMLNLNVPITLRMDVIKNLLSDAVKTTRKQRHTLADELNYRLKWFYEFGDTQCVNLLDFFNDATLNKQYLSDFWLKIISFLIDRGVSEQHLLDLYNLTNQSGNVISDLKKFNDSINTIFYDEPNFLDGLSPEKVRSVLFKSSTLVELKEIGIKYNVNVPRRLKKSELLEFIFEELKSRNSFDAKFAEELSKKSVIMIQRFAIDNKIKVSTELKKEEIIEYILENANQTKENYFKPESNPYHFEVEDDEDTLIVETFVQQDTKEVVEEKTVIHEQLVQVKETVVIPSQNSEDQKNKLVDLDLESNDEVSKSTNKKNGSNQKLNTKNVEHLEINEIKEDVQVDNVQQEIIYERLFINAFQYQGKPKDFSSTNLELIKPQETQTVRSSKGKVPAEFRILFGMLKALLLVVFKVLELLIIIALILTFIVFVYATLVHFINPEFLNPINDIVSGIDLFGKSILEHFSDLYARIGF